MLLYELQYLVGLVTPLMGKALRSDSSGLGLRGINSMDFDPMFMAGLLVACVLSCYFA